MTCVLLLAAAPAFAADHAAEEPIVPVIEGAWWSIASIPQLPEAYHNPKQEPVDFAVWQAADGTWQLWSCIRNTRCGGHSRLLYGWEGASLTATDWTPKGIVMESRPDLGEAPGGLQAPHVVRVEDRYRMAYGNWEQICFATSTDGKHFDREVQPGGHTGVFGEGPRGNARDPMLLRSGDVWYCYYTAIINARGYGLCRSSSDLQRWSPSCVVSYGGRVGPGPWNNESPHVVEVLPGEFIYFRNQYYGAGQTNWAYYSRNPLNFGIDDDTGLVARLCVAAPEIVLDGEDFYLASLKPGLDGIQLARLAFYRCGGPGKPVFDFDTSQGREGWRVTEGRFPAVFSDRPHAEFGGPSRFVIGTAETGQGTFDDAHTGVIESPPFTIEGDFYYVLVGGGYDPERLYVAVVDEESGREIGRHSGVYANSVEPQRLFTGDSKQRKARVRIVDRSTGPWGHINFGGLYAEGPRQRLR